jgi:hypothetical protein
VPTHDRGAAAIRTMAPLAATAFGTSAVLHVTHPGEMAQWVNWPRSDHYQREIAVFAAVHALGLLRPARYTDDASYLQPVSLTGPLLSIRMRKHHRSR